MQTITVPIIRTDADFDEACDRLARISNAPMGTAEHDEASVLYLTIEAYQEANHQKPDDVTPLESVRFEMDSRGLTQSDLVPAFGDRSRVSDFLSGKRELSKSQMRKLHEMFNIPYGLLMGDGTSQRKASSRSSVL